MTKLQHDSSIKVTLPNAEAIHSNLKGELSLSPELSAKAQSAIVLLQLKISSLLSLGQLCDDDCNINLNKNTLIVIKDNKIIMNGTKNKSYGLWDMPIYPYTIQEIYFLPPSIASLIKEEKKTIITQN